MIHTNTRQTNSTEVKKENSELLQQRFISELSAFQYLARNRERTPNETRRMVELQKYLRENGVLGDDGRVGGVEQVEKKPNVTAVQAAITRLQEITKEKDREAKQIANGKFTRTGVRTRNVGKTRQTSAEEQALLHVALTDDELIKLVKKFQDNDHIPTTERNAASKARIHNYLKGIHWSLAVISIEERYPGLNQRPDALLRSIVLPVVGKTSAEIATSTATLGGGAMFELARRGSLDLTGTGDGLSDEALLAIVAKRGLNLPSATVAPASPVQPLAPANTEAQILEAALLRLSKQADEMCEGLSAAEIWGLMDPDAQESEAQLLNTQLWARFVMKQSSEESSQAA